MEDWERTVSGTFTCAKVRRVTGSNGKFAGGKVNVDAFMFACGAAECATSEANLTIRLRPR